MSQVQRTCKVCEKVFNVRQCIIDQGNGNCCSRSCAAKSRQTVKTVVVVQCALCGIDVEKKPSALKGSKSGLFFCSMKHKAEAQKIGGIQEIMPDHYGTSTHYETHRKDHCERCGYRTHKEIIHVHHIDCNRENNDPSNLISLCPNCHEETHFLEKSGKWSRRRENRTPAISV